MGLLISVASVTSVGKEWVDWVGLVLALGRVFSFIQPLIVFSFFLMAMAERWYKRWANAASPRGAGASRCLV